MTPMSGACFPITASLSVLNLAGLGYAVATAEPVHAGVHAVFALGFGFVASRLRPEPAAPERQAGQEALEDEVGDLRQELIDMQDRLDFTERMLAQGLESRGAHKER